MQSENRKYGMNKQAGSTLVVSLVILIILMLLGVGAITTSDTQFQLAGNLQFENAAMNNTETAITTAETWLASGTNYTDPAFTAPIAATPHLYSASSVPAPDPLSIAWDNNNSASVAGNDNQRFIIEQLSANNRLNTSNQTMGRGSSGCNMVNTYQITARGESRRGATKFIQSFYSVLLPLSSCS